MFETPILMVLYNRPKETQRLFNVIRKVRPKKLYIAVDGAKNGQDQKRIDRVKRIVGKVDWTCETNYKENTSNLGCGKAVSQAINWFFENVEQGIILEDDCIPHKSFFEYCKIMLDKYKNDDKVMMITGTNYNSELIKTNHFFSKIFPIWGWATWERAWNKYDYYMCDWDGKEIEEFKVNKLIDSYYKDTFNLIRNNEIDTWDIQWLYASLKNKGFCVTPKTNLITNIGLAGDHTKGGDKYNNMKTEGWDNIGSEDVKFIKQNKSYDYSIYRTLYFEIVLRMFKNTVKNVLGTNKLERSGLGNDMTENKDWWNI